MDMLFLIQKHLPNITILHGIVFLDFILNKYHTLVPEFTRALGTGTGINTRTRTQTSGKFGYECMLSIKKKKIQILSPRVSIEL